MSSALLLPGHGDTPTMSKYDTIAGVYESQGIKPIRVPIEWRADRRPRAYVEMAHAHTQTLVSEPVHLFGFSYGAVCALQIAANPKLRIGSLVTCSLSPVHTEDRSKLWPWMRIWAASRYANREPWLEYSIAADRLNEAQIPHAMLQGSREWWILGARLDDHRRRIFASAKTSVVAGAKHDLADAVYNEAAIRATEDVLESL